MTVFKNINIIRKKNKISQKEIAYFIGMSQTGFGKSLKEETLKVVDLIKVADFLNTDVCEFFKESSNVYKVGDTVNYSKEPDSDYIHERVFELKYTIELQKQEIKRLNKLLTEKRTK